MAELLIEIFSEEIPARMQKRALEDLTKMVSHGITEAGLSYGAKHGFVTPRRLTLILDDVPAQSMNTREERKGPRVDAPEKALEGFLRSTGLEKNQLEVRDDKKGKVYFAVIEKQGRPAQEIIAEVLNETIRNFPWPKSMRWGNKSLRWVRPIRSILAILSDGEESEIIPFEIEGIEASNTTQGHRFMAPDTLTIHNAEDYADKLAKAYVVLSPEDRADKIRNDAKTAAFALGFELIENEKLLRENAGLCEYPVVYVGEIQPEFHELPPEVIETSMAEHQKFLSLKNADDAVRGYVIVANRETADQGQTIKAGNAKVLSARLADAKFFWENDLRMAQSEGLTAWVDQLANVTFHNKLGSQAERIARIEDLTRKLAPLAGADAEDATTAARLAKADLSSEMVFEFPELQGVMGTYYAKAAGFSDAIANVASEHYSPLGPTDEVPSAPLSVAGALADKIDLLTSFWAIDDKPTGSKDPFALRRAALGVIRIILENDLRLNLMEALQASTQQADFADLHQFIMDRLAVYLRDQGIRHDVIRAILQLGDSDDLSLNVERIRALNTVLGAEGGADLQEGVKRALNILRAEEEKDGVSYELEADAKLMSQDAEIALKSALDRAEKDANEAIQAGDFAHAMDILAGLRPQIDAFFTDVVVNDDNAIIRRNRLCLLNQIRELSHQLADFNALEG